MSTALDSLKQVSTVVADTGDFESIAQYKPQDATTNPSLILAAVKQEKYAKLIGPAVEYGKSQGGSTEDVLAHAQRRLLVEFGRQILRLIPGRVSTEIDASLSFDTQGTVQEGLRIIQLYEQMGISKERVLLKIASTYDGILAARILEKEHGVHCNMTLLFSLVQAAACAEAGVTLISPFVGRILDWYTATTGRTYAPDEDPGVVSVRTIYTYYKQHGFRTAIMAASFRNVGEIQQLAGTDLLTISPTLLQQLQTSQSAIGRTLSPELAKAAEVIPVVSYIHDRTAFNRALFENQMAFDKLFEGVRAYANDAKTLRRLLAAQV